MCIVYSAAAFVNKCLWWCQILQAVHVQSFRLLGLQVWHSSHHLSMQCNMHYMLPSEKRVHCNVHRNVE